MALSPSSSLPRRRPGGTADCLVKIRYRVGGTWKKWCTCTIRDADDERTKLLATVPFVENILVTGAVLGGWMPESKPKLARSAANETTRPPHRRPPSSPTPGAAA